MTEFRNYIVRPSPKPARTDFRDVFWIYLSPANLLLHGLRPGDNCRLQTPRGAPTYAIVFENAKIQDSVVQTSKTLQAIYGLKLGDNISLSPSRESIPVVTQVALEEVVKDEAKGPISESDRVHWAWIVEDALKRAEYLCPGLVFDVEAIRQERSFKVTKVNGSVDVTVHRFVPDSNFEVRIEATGSQSEALLASEHRSLEISNDGIAGLDAQLLKINRRLSACGNFHNKFRFRASYPSRQGGIIIHGPSGTGKTLILNHVVKSGWESAFHLEIIKKGRGESDSVVRQAFAEARRRQPSVIVIDGIENICGKSQPQASFPTINMTTILCTEMDSLGDARVLVIATARSLSDIDDDLRIPGRFKFEVETTVPDSKSRIEILKIISGLSKDAEFPELHSIGERTHGYVGADLLTLFLCAMDKAEDRVLGVESSNATDKTNGINEAEPEITVTEADLNAALLEVRPTAMREVFLETPKVRWGDIGGQHEVKNSLQKAIEWPFKVHLFFIGQC